MVKKMTNDLALTTMREFAPAVILAGAIITLLFLIAFSWELYKLRKKIYEQKNKKETLQVGDLKDKEYAMEKVRKDALER